MKLMVHMGNMTHRLVFGVYYISCVPKPTMISNSISVPTTTQIYIYIFMVQNNLYISKYALLYCSAGLTGKVSMSENAAKNNRFAHMIAVHQSVPVFSRTLRVMEQGYIETFQKFDRMGRCV